MKKKNSTSGSLGSGRAASVAKSLRDKAYGTETEIYKKPSKPEKDSETYIYGDKRTRNTKFYNSSRDEATGTKASILSSLKKAKVKDLSDKEARSLNEGMDPKARGKEYSKVTYSKADRDAYNLVMKRAAESGLSPKEADKAIKNAIRVTSAGIKSDRSRTVTRVEGVAKRELKKKQKKLERGY